MILRKKTWVKVCIVVVAFFTFVSTAYAATWWTSDKWGNWQDNGYTLYNNIWGSGAGHQTLWANSYSNWGVWADHPNTGGIKSYPNSTRFVNARLSELSSLTSNFNVSVPNNGAYVTAYDIWADNHAYEIMLWMNHHGAVKPISYNWDANGEPVPVQTNLSLGGHTWNVYRGTNGANEVFSFVRTSNTNSGHVDILAVMNWIQQQGWYGDVSVSEVQFGYEITSSAGGLDFITNSFSASFTH